MIENLFREAQPTRHPFAAPTAHQYAFLRPGEHDVFNCELYRHFTEGPMFVAVAEGTIDTGRLLAAHGAQLRRGGQVEEKRAGRKWSTVNRLLLFQLESDCWLFVNTNVRAVRVFARQPSVAETRLREIMDRFRIRPPRRRAAGFQLLSTDGGEITAREVSLRTRTQRSASELALLYGDTFPAWEENLCSILRTPRPGLAIFRGPPGTGKTSFIRHLLWKLKATHRFYYVSPSDLCWLTSPKLVEFWAGEGADHRRTPRIIVMEDAEGLLEQRPDGQRACITDMLNVADGLLSDFLQMKLICTVNCPVERLDPAVVRSGRLLACRDFPRLSPAQATRIAAAHGLSIPSREDHSLAEIFAGSPLATAAPARRPIGFAATTGVPTP